MLNKKIISLMLATMLATSAFCVPAKPGMWRTMKLANGGELRVQLVGDESMHYFASEDGKCYVTGDDGLLQPIEKSTLLAQTAKQRASFGNAQKAQMAKKVAGADNVMEGNKKALIILVEFPDLKFQSGHDQEFYNRMANEENFTTDDGFHNSVRDYFRDQSLGKLLIDFDVVGPIMADTVSTYYGAGYSVDLHIGKLVSEMCNKIDDQVNFADYDWTGNGEVDEVFLLYAGTGTNTSGVASEIWPHMWTLSSSDYGSTMKLDGVTVNTYACSSEMTYNTYNGRYQKHVDGIGTFCHEFSHCMGFPDVYDTGYSGSFGMNCWSLMDYGSYNDNAFTPSGYTAYERWVGGWISPVELTEQTEVDNLQTLGEGGDAYIIYNAENQDEVIMMENRQQTDWDAPQPGSGLMIYHIDYDKYIWDQNTVNNSSSHQRYTIFHADGTDGTSTTDLAGDPFPYGDNNSMNSLSENRATWYTANEDGSYFVKGSINDITRNDDGTISFKYYPTSVERDAYTLVETFDANDGRGGNDGRWTSSSKNELLTDLEGWEVEEAYAANRCARLGTANSAGKLTSPEFEVLPEAVLTCKAARYSSQKDTMTVAFINSETGDTTIIAQTDLSTSGWIACEYPLNVTGKGRLVFSTNLRQFLDQVMVTKPETSGISGVTTNQKHRADNRVYSIDGRYLGRNIDALGHGIYIVNGRKVAK